MVTTEIESMSKEDNTYFGSLFDDLDFLQSRGPTVTISKEQVQTYFLPKHLATELYDLLKCTHAIFQHFGITYWLTGGSMIGYMRHGGIIPWDDDIDICCFNRDKEKIFSEEVQDAFRRNNVKVVEDQTFNIVSPTLSKIYRSTVKSKAHKSGQVPYPFVDIFYMVEPNEHSNSIRFMSNGNDHHWISPEELFPLKKIQFGPVTAMAPSNPLPQLERGYGEEWSEQGQIHACDHITKQGRGGPTQVFDVTPFRGVSAEYDPHKITCQVILPPKS